jgi:hypothetical protein
VDTEQFSVYYTPDEVDLPGRPVPVPGLAPGVVASEDFLYSQAGVAEQGSGRLSDGTLISAIVSGHVTWVDGMVSEKDRGRSIRFVSGRILNVIPFYTLAANPRLFHSDLPRGTMVFAPGIIGGILNAYHIHHSGRFEVMDECPGCGASKGHTESLDMYVGEGPWKTLAKPWWSSTSPEQRRSDVYKHTSIIP